MVALWVHPWWTGGRLRSQSLDGQSKGNAAVPTTHLNNKGPGGAAGAVLGLGGVLVCPGLDVCAALLHHVAHTAAVFAFSGHNTMWVLESTYD